MFDRPEQIYYPIFVVICVFCCVLNMFTFTLFRLFSMACAEFFNVSLGIFLKYMNSVGKN